MTKQATFVPLKGYEGVYWINSNGNIVNAKRETIKPCGEDRIELRKEGSRELKSISLLIIETFMEDTKHE